LVCDISDAVWTGPIGFDSFENHPLMVFIPPLCQNPPGNEAGIRLRSGLFGTFMVRRLCGKRRGRDVASGQRPLTAAEDVPAAPCWYEKRIKAVFINTKFPPDSQ